MDSGVDLTAVSEPRQLASDLCRSASMRRMNGPYRSDRSFFFAQGLAATWAERTDS